MVFWKDFRNMGYEVEGAKKKRKKAVESEEYKEEKFVMGMRVDGIG